MLNCYGKTGWFNSLRLPETVFKLFFIFLLGEEDFIDVMGSGDPVRIICKDGELPFLMGNRKDYC